MFYRCISDRYWGESQGSRVLRLFKDGIEEIRDERNDDTTDEGWENTSDGKATDNSGS